VPEEAVERRENALATLAATHATQHVWSSSGVALLPTWSAAQSPRGP
jgi:hypothetical protein